MRLLRLILLLACLLPAFARAQTPITILTQPDVLSDYLSFLQGRDPLSLTRFDGPHSRRDVVELVLVQQALQLGGNRRPVKLVTVNATSDSYTRYLKEIAAGSATLGGNPVWLSDLKPLTNQVFISPPAIRQGEFEAGLYALPENQRALAVRDLAQLRKLTAVVAASWTPDVRTLESLGLPRILKTHSWESMLGMLRKGRADFLLAPFQPGHDMLLQSPQGQLRPIPGIKVGLQGSRHFFVSRKADNAGQIAQMLNAGLEQLRQSGRLQQAYRDSGFFNAQTQDWLRLN